MNRPSMVCLSFAATVLLAACTRDAGTRRDGYFQSARGYMEQKRYEEAVIELRNALRIDPGHVPSYLALAEAFQKLGDHKEAVTALRKVIELDPADKQARIELGRYYIAGGMVNPKAFELARGMADAVLAVDGGNNEARVLLGSAYAGLNQLDKSAKELEAALRSDPNDLSAALNLGAVLARKKEAARAEAVFKEAIERHPDSTRPHLAIASFYASTGRAEQAEHHLKKAFEANPADKTALYALATFYEDAGRPRDVESVFRQARTRRPRDREPRWGLANHYLKQGNSAEALRILDELVAENPEDRQARLLAAEVCLGRGEYQEAEKRFRPLLDKNPSDADARYLLGKSLRIQGRNERALEEFDAALKVNETLAPALLEKAGILMNRGDYDAAQTALERILERDRENLAVRGALAKVLALRQMPQDALEQAAKVLEGSPNNQDALTARGDAYLSLGKTAEAKADFARLCDLRPDYAPYWHRLGLAEAAAGNTTAALARFRKAIELKADYVPALNDILALHMRKKDYRAALAELERPEMKTLPVDEIHNLRGIIYMEQGKPEAAEAELRKAVATNPSNYQAYILLGQLNIQRNDVQQAIREVDRLIAQDGKFVPGYLMKAYYLEVVGDAKGAIDNYRRVLELEPENVFAANNLAWLLCERGDDLDEALRLAQAAKRKAPENPEVADTLGWIYYKLKQYALAVDQLVFSVNNRRAQTQHYYRLGMAYYGKGDLILAQQSLRKALEMNDSMPWADEARRILGIKR